MLVSNNSVGKDVWLNGFSKSSTTRRIYRNGFDRFIRFMNETEGNGWDDKRLLKEREVDLQQRNYGFEQKVIEFHRWLDKLKLSGNAKKTHITAICSFFAFHRMDLKFIKQQRNQIWKRAKPVRKYYEFILDDLKRMNQVANPKERYVLLVGKSLGLRVIDFLRLKQGTFEARLKGEAPISLGEIFTKKEGVTAKPFLDEDAIDASKTWLRILESKNERKPERRMLDISKQEVNLIIKKLTKRAGINTGNEGVRFHQLRVFLITRLSKVMETNRWKQIVGKTISEGAYVKPFLLRDDYAKVMPLTTVQEIVAQDEVVKLKEEVTTLRKKEDLARTEVDTIKEKMRLLEKQFNDLKEMVKKLEWKQYYSLSEAFGTKIVRGKDAERVLEELEESIEQSENEET